MWVIIVLWFTGVDGDFVGVDAFSEVQFADRPSCVTFIGDNQRSLVNSVQDIKRGPAYSITCANTDEYPILKETLRGETRVWQGI